MMFELKLESSLGVGKGKKMILENNLSEDVLSNFV